MNTRETVLNACLAYEFHQGGDQWRKVFKQALNALKVKAGREYKFLVAMSEQKSSQMEKVIKVLLGTI